MFMTDFALAHSSSQKRNSLSFLDVISRKQQQHIQNKICRLQSAKNKQKLKKIRIQRSKILPYQNERVSIYQNKQQSPNNQQNQQNTIGIMKNYMIQEITAAAVQMGKVRHQSNSFLRSSNPNNIYFPQLIKKVQASNKNITKKWKMIPNCQQKNIKMKSHHSQRIFQSKESINNSIGIIKYNAEKYQTHPIRKHNSYISHYITNETKPYPSKLFKKLNNIVEQ